jgi:hypothetical protein
MSSNVPRFCTVVIKEDGDNDDDAAAVAAATTTTINITVWGQLHSSNVVD